MAWKSTHEEFDESAGVLGGSSLSCVSASLRSAEAEELGRSGIDLLPNPLSMPVAVRASFDTRQVSHMTLHHSLYQGTVSGHLPLPYTGPTHHAEGGGPEAGRGGAL